MKSLAFLGHKKISESDPLLISIIVKAFYVDDLLTGGLVSKKSPILNQTSLIFLILLDFSEESLLLIAQRKFTPKMILPMSDVIVDVLVL